jgi:hypothetical protein
VTGISGDETSIADCPTDHPYVMGGGFFEEPSGTQVPPVVDSNPVPPPQLGEREAWAAQMDGNGVASITAYAICVK